jgi:magnesium transporter
MAGLYGMNFDYLPELHYAWAYPVLLGLRALVAIVMLIYFRRRGWLGGGGDSEGD